MKFRYTKTTGPHKNFKIVIGLVIIKLIRRLYVSIKHVWQRYNHISGHKLLGDRWF